MSKSVETPPLLRIRSGGELRLTNGSLAGMMSAVLDRGARFRFKALGYSMSPFIRDGDVLTIAPAAGKPLRRGDVVVFLHPAHGGPVVHRIVGRTDEGFVIKGDHEIHADSPVPEPGIIGVVVGTERKGRRVRIGLGPGRGIVARLSSLGVFSRLFVAFGRAARRNRRGLGR